MTMRPGPAAWAAAFAAAFGGGSLGAQPVEDPDWPCVQRKVASLTPASIWTGPALGGGATDWADDPEVASLVARLAQRRLPIEDAEAEVEAFAAGLDPAKREERLTRLFAGLFETMSAERGEIMTGIERYARRQRTMAQEIRAESARLDEARASADADARDVVEAEADLAGRIRVFDERRASLPFVCETPRLVEQRLFALGRAIGVAIEG